MPIKKIRGYEEKFFANSTDEERTEIDLKVHNTQKPFTKNKIGCSIIIFVLLFAANIVFSSFA